MKTHTRCLKALLTLTAISSTACAIPLSESNTQARVPVSAYPAPQRTEGFAPHYPEDRDSTPATEVAEVAEEVLSQSPVGSSVSESSSESTPSSESESREASVSNTRTPALQIESQSPRFELTLQTEIIASGYQLRFVTSSESAVGSGALRMDRITGVGEFTEDRACAEGRALVRRDANQFYCLPLASTARPQWINGIEVSPASASISEFSLVAVKPEVRVTRSGDSVIAVNLQWNELSSEVSSARRSVCASDELAIGVRNTYGRRIIQNRAQRVLKQIQVLCKKTEAVLSEAESSLLRPSIRPADLSDRLVIPEVQPPLPVVR